MTNSGDMHTEASTDRAKSTRKDEYGGSVDIPLATFPDAEDVQCTDEEAKEVVIKWLTDFNAGTLHFTGSECYWRDHLGLSWDFRTLTGERAIQHFLAERVANASRRELLRSLDLDTSPTASLPHTAEIDDVGRIHGVEALLTFETEVGRGRGVVRLVKVKGKEGGWKAFSLFTTLTELKGHEEPLGKRRTQGVQHGADPRRRNWAERRRDEVEFADRQPTVLIIGAGQSGLMLAARLRMLSIPHLIIDQNDRIGDNWRKRYHQLVLHDPIWYDQMPYVPFPPHWPVFTAKDKLAEWFECYAKILELNIWMRSTVGTCEWDGGSKVWKVKVLRRKDGDGEGKAGEGKGGEEKEEERTFEVKHVVLATGHSGKANFPSHIPGISSFEGDRLCHSSMFSGASLHGHNKHAVIVGCCNSGHDIAQDFVEKGYKSVTMVQRSTTCVLSSKECVKGLEGAYDDDHPDTEESDILLHGTPSRVLKAKHVQQTKRQAEGDKAILEGLARAGFALDSGPMGAGLFLKYFQRGGGYYIDVGASQLIIDGKIKIKQGQGIQEILPHGIRFDDGTELPADEIVFATGYQNMRTQAETILGKELGDQVKDVWGFNEEGEVRTMWRNSGHEAFWFMGGNFAFCRYYSRLLALQIKAKELGIWSGSA